MKVIRLIGAAVALIALTACSTSGLVNGAAGAAAGDYRPADGAM